MAQGNSAGHHFIYQFYLQGFIYPQKPLLCGVIGKTSKFA